MLLAAALLTCDRGGRQEETESRVFAETSVLLAPSSQWQQLNASGTFMTTPRWMPDGSGVVASGYLGVGLFFLRPGDLEAQVIDPGFRGLVTFESGGRTLCLRPSGSDEVLALDLKDGGPAARPAGCPCPAEDTVRILFESGETRIAQDRLHGTLTWADGEGESVVEEAAWSAAPAPDGLHVAYCTGHLTDPVLHVYGGGSDGEKIVVGRGAHPAWLPNGRFLIYSRPEADASGRVVRSDLYLFDVEQGLSVRLTETPGIVEMQPAISPDGRSVVFSDWKTGALMAASLKEGAP